MSRWWLRNYPGGAVLDGVRVFDLSINRTDEQVKHFIALIRVALNRMREHDPVWHRRVTGRLLYIVMTDCPTYAQFDPDTRACEIDYCQVEGELADSGWDTDEKAVCLARFLIHEATHAYLMDRGIPYRKDNCLRVEHVCEEQEYAFLRKLPEDK